ncbi:MAG: hypothetical protein PHY48_06280 [Candidatus Cloacimonetes bacterium]|nr:hypothetical protein [Candidatus Cloacimonadota bacterium]
MKIQLIALLIIIILGLFSCSGSDPLDQDTDPPYSPILRPHLGDTGDAPVFWNNQNIIITDETNGIDAVSDGNFIRIPWEPFVDTDLSHINVFRFSNHDTTPVEIASNVPASDTYYLDTSNDLVQRYWYSYYIHLYDGSGNFSISDTVSYALLGKCTLVSPQDGATVSPISLTLQWSDMGTNASSFRVLIWNESGKLIYTENQLIDIPAGTYEITVPNNLEIEDDVVISSGDVLRWRVDAFDYDATQDADMGSESQERTFIIQ